MVHHLTRIRLYSCSEERNHTPEGRSSVARLTSGEALKGIEDDLPDAYLFNIEMIPKWSEKYVPLLTIGQLNIPFPLHEKQALVQKAASFVMLAGRMYRLGKDGILRLCIEHQEKEHYLIAAHITIGGIHMAANQTIKRILWAGVWWPTMRAEVHTFVRACSECHSRPPKSHATLFQVAIAPNWSKYIVDFLQHRTLPEKVSKVRSKAIELESKEYELIANQLYKRVDWL